MVRIITAAALLAAVSVSASAQDRTLPAGSYQGVNAAAERTDYSATYQGRSEATAHNAARQRQAR